MKSFLLLILFVSCSMFATTRYVATTGSDSNPGTNAAPYATIQKGVDNSSAGDTVIVKSGTYNYGSGAIAVTINKIGTSTNPIVIKSQSLYGAILNGQNSLADYCFVFGASAQHIKVEGFDINGFEKGAFWCNSGGDYVTIRNNKVHNLGRIGTLTHIGQGLGLYISAGSNYVVVDGNIFYDNGRLHPDEGAPADPNYYWRNHDHHIYISGANYLTVTNNVFYDAHSGYSIQIVNSSSSNIDIINNVFGTWNEYMQPVRVAGSYINVSNNLFTANTYGIYNAGPTSYSTLKNNVSDHYVIYGTSGITSSSGNVNFATNINVTNEAGHDYTPTSSSTDLINKGTSSSAPSIDLLGNTRPVDSYYDVGAYEYGGSSNQAPNITSSPNTTALENSGWSYTITATDPDGDSIIYNYEGSLPFWMSWNAGTHTLSGTPTYTALGTHSITLTATDDLSNKSIQSFDVEVIDVNNAPTFSSTPNYNAIVDSLWSYQIIAYDVDLDTIVESIVFDSIATWMSVDSNIGGDGTYQFIATSNYMYLRNHVADTTNVTNFSLTDEDGVEILDGVDFTKSYWLPTTASGFEATMIDYNSFSTLNDSSAGGFVYIDLTVGEKYTVVFETDNDSCLIYNGVNNGSRWPLENCPILYGTPSVSDPDTNYVKIGASDGKVTTYQDFDIIILGTNTSPTYDSCVVRKLLFSELVAIDTFAVSADTLEFTFPGAGSETRDYMITTSDVDFDVITYSLIGAPSWISLEAADLTYYSIRGVPTASTAVYFTLRISDGVDIVDKVIKAIPIISN